MTVIYEDKRVLLPQTTIKLDQETEQVVPEEIGTVLVDEGNMLIVQVDPQYFLDGEDYLDDGIREILKKDCELLNGE